MNIVQRLRQAGRSPESPLVITLDSGELRIDAWLRVLPGKRLVGRGELDGRPVLAKLFIGDRAARHAERERAGIAALDEANIRTPKLIDSGELEGGGQFILSELLTEARSLQALWDGLQANAVGSPEAQALLGHALRAVAQMHAAGLLQGDLHLGNFLLAADELHVIDGDAVEAPSPGEPLPRDSAERNLALLFAQLPPAWDDHRESLLIEYLMVNPHRAIQPERLDRWVARLRESRLDDYLDKTVRDCSLFAVQRGWLRFAATLRERREELEGILAHPDQALQGQLIKAGGSSSVARWQTGTAEVLVKRYNIKSFSHWLRRFWRPSRAWHAWQAGHRLRFLGLDTPAPLAMIEERFGPLRRRAWLVTEFSSGRELLGLLGDGATLPEGPLRKAIIETFGGLHAARISHGDCKATNFLWDGQLLLIIDLDAMQAHRDGEAWRRAWAEDRSRFIRNWPPASPLAQWLEEQLPR